MNVSSKYLFTLKLKFASTPVGGFPDGRRIDVRYTGSVMTYDHKYKADWGQEYTAFDVDDEDDGSEDEIEWRGLTGSVVSGADSVLIRSDSVASFAGRLTIRAKDKYLINTQLTGAVDLYQLFGQDPPTLKNFYDKAARDPSSPASGSVGTVLGISFEGATSEQEWAEADLTQKAYFRYQLLLRGSFVASGTTEFDTKGLPKSAELDVTVVRA
jgi:hypothetical protein